jgi:hypothetical protein
MISAVRNGEIERRLGRGGPLQRQPLVGVDQRLEAGEFGSQVVA